MHRRRFVKTALASTIPFTISVRADAVSESSHASAVPDGRSTAPLDMRSHGEIRVAFVISSAAEIVDFGGPWGVFEYVFVGAPKRNPFKLYTVAATSDPVAISGGMIVQPNFPISDAPLPDIIVAPALALDELDSKMLDWIKRAHATTQLTMSVCNGSFVLAKAGLLNGKNATSHSGAYDEFQRMFPTVKLQRGKRWVEDGKLATAGGLTSGQDLALRVVERYFGREEAKAAAKRLEYQSVGWMYPDSNSGFA